MPKIGTRYATVEDMLRALRPSYPVHCIYPQELERAARRFLAEFPGRVLYATKCNPHPLILKTLYESGIHDFDTASLAEIGLVSELLPEAEAYFHHPVKSRAAIANALQVYGVRHFTVDHEAELDKVAEVAGNAKIAVQVRLATPSGLAVIDLSRKFGATPEQAVHMLREARRLGLEVGLSFHVGSQCSSPRAYGAALDLLGEVIVRSGVAPSSINVGGGFPAPYVGTAIPPLEDYFAAIRKGFSALSVSGAVSGAVPGSVSEDCVFMCEPGRALVAEASTILTQILLRKDRRIYINDGIYGSLSEIKTGNLTPAVRLIRLDAVPASAQEPMTVFGATCDGIDVLPNPMMLPADAREGDWIEIAQMGAYSNALSTSFNGLQAETFVVMEGSPKDWPE